MGLLERFRSAGHVPAGGNESKADTSEQDALRLLDEGNAIEDEGRIEEALQRYEEAIRLVPNLARAHLNRGNILSTMGEMERALEAFASDVRSHTAAWFAAVAVLVIISRTVWLRKAATSLSRTIRRMRPCCKASTPNGGSSNS